VNLIKYLHTQSWKLLLLATVGSVIGGLCGAAMVSTISEAITHAHVRAHLAWTFFGLCLSYLILKSVSELALLRLTQSATLQLRISLSRKLLNTPLKKLQSMGKVELLVILTKDIDAFIQAFQLLPLAVGNGVIIIGCLAFIGWISIQIFAMFTVGLITCLFCFHFAERRPLAKLAKVREQMDVLYAHFQSLISGSKELQLNKDKGTRFVEQVITPDCMEYKQAYVEGMSGYTLVGNVGTIVFYLVIGVILFLVPLWLPQPAQVLVAVTLVLLYLIRPISEMMFVIPPLRQAGIALKKIQQLDDALSPALRSAPDSRAFQGTGPHVLELRGVYHHYQSQSEDADFTLGPIDLNVKQGEILFIIGRNGSGKTTLAMLLLGLYQPEQGAITLNGIPVDSTNLEGYRQHFAAVFSDFHLFERLLNGMHEGITELASRYVERFQMSHKVKINDGRFSTTALSAGQRKRLALVSSYLEDRPFYLFDEWAADQDPSFRKIFYTELLPDLRSRGKAVIVITHDDTYFSCADRVIKLENGVIQGIQSAERIVSSFAN
jgi:putative ATP-binding cassette transporter